MRIIQSLLWQTQFLPAARTASYYPQSNGKLERWPKASPSLMPIAVHFTGAAGTRYRIRRRELVHGETVTLIRTF